MLNRTMKVCLILLVLVGFLLSSIGFLRLFYNSIEFTSEDLQDDIIPQHYQLEFIDHVDHLICHLNIFFQLTQNRKQLRIRQPIDHTIERSSIILYDKQSSIPIEIQIENNQIIIKKLAWKNIFYQGNYTIAISSYINLRKENFIHQTWSSKYRILFTKNYLFPHFSHSYYRSTFNINIISSDYIISNLPLHKTSSSFEISHVAFTLLHQYDCRSMNILQLCFPIINASYEIDLYSHLFNYTLNTIQIFETFFSQKFSLDKLTFVTVLELNDEIISKPGLVFVDQNALLVNTSAEQIIQQHELIFLVVAYQWIDATMQFDQDTKWFSQSLAKNIARHLFHRTNDPIENNHSHIERFMSTIVRDSLCNINSVEEANHVKSEHVLIAKGEAYLNEYRLYIGDDQFHTRIQQLIQQSHDSFINQSALLSIFFRNISSILTLPKLSGHPIVLMNSSTIDMHLFKLNQNCSLPISSTHPIVYHRLNDSFLSVMNSSQIFSNSSSFLIPFNPFIHMFYSSWNHLVDEIKILLHHQPFHSFSKLLFDSFLFNLANQISIKYSLQLINLFFQQPIISITKNDLVLIHKILQWYRSMLSNSFEENILVFLRKILNPYCSNQLWTRQLLIDVKYYNQQIINDIFLELCCSINHSICLQHIPIRNDPQILLQFIFNNQRFDSQPERSIDYRNQTNMLTSSNQLRIPSLFIYPDRITMNIVCQTVRQQNDKYWYELIHFLEQKFQHQSIPSSIVTGLSCAIQTKEQTDFYLNNLCPPSPFKWTCYRNILTYSSMKNFEQLKTIDNEEWPQNNDEFIDFLFHTNIKQGNFSLHPMIHEFQLLAFTWLTTNQYELLHWLDNENNQNAYLI
ncbi:unnamed protein product [Rotaria magnacalcarata]|uniref:Peptidase M1 membrane alanine aminopeptidase domain-containing protein n=1 Tax=Rotaria magnacalcarata TaxID=392030 RepID=A0A818ZX23_9BILA|nr:unnamed protein product [Rotaria magnacalcarata]CAF3778423.1 unnamed protein product [Rotaria magnacalcarata]